MLQPPNKNRVKRESELLKYTAMSFKMGAVITAGFVGGHYIDRYFALKFPITTLTLGMASLALSLFIVIRDTREK